MERLDLNYYYGQEAEQFTFYRLPKALITDPRFKDVSNNAKLLYKGSYYMEWKFNLWDGGVLTCNSFTLTFVDEDIQELMKYLKRVMEDKTKK